jgi:hypothetical protein
MKKFCVLFLSREDWDDPEVIFVEGKDENDAHILALEKMGYSEEEEEEIMESGVYAVKVREVK